MTPASSLLTDSVMGAHDAVGSRCTTCACDCLSDPNGDDPNNNAVVKPHASGNNGRRTLEEKPELVQMPVTVVMDRRKPLELLTMEVAIVNEGKISEPAFVDNLDGNDKDEDDDVEVVQPGSAPNGAAAAQDVVPQSASWPPSAGIPIRFRPILPTKADDNGDSPAQPQEPQEQQVPPPRARPVSALALALAKVDRERLAAESAANQAAMQRQFEDLRAPAAPVHDAAAPSSRRSGRRRHHSRSRNNADAAVASVAAAAQRMVARPLPQPVAAPQPVFAPPPPVHCSRNFRCDMTEELPHKLGCHRYQSPNVLYTLLHCAYVVVYCVLYLLGTIISGTFMFCVLTDYPYVQIKLGLVVLAGIGMYFLCLKTDTTTTVARSVRSAVYEANGTLRDDGFDDFPEAAKRALRAYHQLVAAGDYDNDYDDDEEYYDYGEYEEVPAVAYYKVAGLRERRVRKELGVEEEE